MKARVAELRQVANLLFSHLEANGISEVDLQADYYWAIPREERIDPTREPMNLTLGQLSDDLTELRRIADGDSEPVVYALVWLSSVLRDLGESTSG